MTRYDLYNVNFKLKRKKPYLVNRGTKINYILEDIDISCEHLDHVARFRRKEGVADHAILIRTKEDIYDDIKDKDITIKFIVTARHSFSNLSSVTKKLFLDPGRIHIDKEFKFGKRLDVTS